MGTPGERITLLDETLDVVEATFAGGSVEVHGTQVTATGFDARPAAVQHPRPPILIGGGAKRILTLAGRRADIVSLNFNNASGTIGLEGMMSSTVEETHKKLGWIRDGAASRDDGAGFDDLEIEIGSYFTVVGDDATVDATASAFGMSGEQFRAYPHALGGTVDAICDEICRRREEYGITYYTINGSSLDAFAPVVAALGGTS